MSLRSIAALSLSLVLGGVLGCAENDDGGRTPTDSGARVDSGRGDGGAGRDGGPGRDSGPDFDAGSLGDAGFDAFLGTDGGPDPDTGVLGDAGMVDIDIRDLQNGSIATGSSVRVAGVVVTAITTVSATRILFAVQEPTGPKAYSGIMVSISPLPSTIPAIGDLVNVTGTLGERESGGVTRTNIDPATVEVVGTGTVPEPEALTEADVAFTAAMPERTEQWEGVLVSVASVVVSALDVPNDEFIIYDDPTDGVLHVDNRFFEYTLPAVGDTYTSITGVVDHQFGTPRLLPRSAGDLVGYTPGLPRVLSLTPMAGTSIEVGSSATLVVTLDRAAPAGGQVVNLVAENPAIADTRSSSVTVAEGETTADVIVDGVGVGGPVSISAAIASVGVGATVSVVAGSSTPVITSTNLAVVAYGANLVISGAGFGTTTDVTIGGVSVAFTASSSTSINVPIVPETVALGTQSIVVTAGGTPSAGYDVMVARILINEVDSDTPSTDVLEFVEISSDPPSVSLAGYVLVFFNGSGDVSYAPSVGVPAIELTGSTNSSGLYLVGNAGVIPSPSQTFDGGALQNGADGVALYQGGVGSFAVGTAPTMTRLIDAVVYDTADADDTGLLDAFFGASGPGRAQWNEAERAMGDTDSVQRCGTRRPGGVFVTIPASPLAASTCP